MVQRNILHKGFFAFIVTFLMAFLALPMGVFADNASDVSADTNAITWDSINGNNASQDNVTENLDSLPTTGTNGSTIVWSSNNTNVISNTGVVTRPTFSEGDKYVELQANLQKGQSFGGATFNLTVKALPPTDAEAVAAALAALTWDSIKGTNSAENNVTAPLTLPSSGSYVTTITWSSNNTAVITNIGSVIRPYSDAENASVTLTATFTKGSETATKAFNLTVIKKEIQTITISDTMSTGDIGSTKEYVLIEDNQVIIAGSKTNADSQLNLSMNPGKTMIWQAAYTSSAGTAISLYDGTFNMTGGSIVSAAGAAITTLGSAAVNISGGYVFGVGTAVPVAATVTSPGVVVSYDSTATGARKIGSSVGLSALPTGATAEWDIQGGVDGISYTLGGNTGFISGTGVDVIPISTDATLSSLAAGPYSLTPDFNKDTVSYRATVPYEVTSILLGATATDEYATVSGIAEQISLSVGENICTVTVTAEDGTTSKTYTIIITRSPQVITESLVLSTGGLSLYGGAALTQNTRLEILGGGSYTWNNGTKTLTLTNVNFTTTEAMALDLRAISSGVNLIINGTNLLASTYNGGFSTDTIYAYGTLTIDGTGSLTVIGSTANGMGSQGIHSDYVTINGGNLGVSAATKAIKVMDTVGTITVNMPAYNWTVEAGNIESSAYPYSTPNFTNATFIQIIPLTGVSPTTANVNIASTPADIPITFSLEGGTSLNSISNAGNDLRANTDYTIANNVVTIKGSYLAGLSAGTATLTFNTSGTTDPTVILTVMNGYEYGLVLESDGLYYNGAKLGNSDSKLGGGSYTYIDGVLSLTNVNFTTRAQMGLDINASGVTINPVGTNSITSTDSIYAVGIHSPNGFTINGAGSLTVTAGTADMSCGIYCSGTLTITNGEVTAEGGDYGIRAQNLTITDGEVTAIGGSAAFNSDITLSLPAAYEWEEDDEEGEYPYDALDYDGGERVYIKAVAMRTRITSTGLTFNKADESASGINIFYTLADNVNRVGDPKIDGVAMAYGIGDTDFDYSAATLRTLSIGEHTIQLITSDGVNPTVTLTVTAVYPNGLVLDRSDSRLEYNDGEVTTEILGGGSYSYEYSTNTLTLTNVNFTTSDDVVLDITSTNHVTINVIGTNTLTSTYLSNSNVYGVNSDNPKINGTGSLTLETDAGKAFINTPQIRMSNYTWEAFTADGVRTSGTSNYTYSSEHTKLKITYQAPYVPPIIPDPVEPIIPDPVDPIIPDPVYYGVTVTGGVSDKSEYEAGETVTVTPDSPASGYRLKSVTAVPAVEITETDGIYSFTMPDGAVTITVEFEAIPVPPSYPSYPSGPPQSRPDTALPPRDDITPEEPETEPTEEDSKKLKVNGSSSDVSVEAIDGDTAEITVDGVALETSSLTAVEAIEDGDAAEAFVTDSGAVSVLTKDNDVIAGSNPSHTLNSASTVKAIEAAGADDLVAEVTVVLGNDTEAISRSAMEKIAEASSETGVTSIIQKNQYNESEEHPNELIYRITLNAVIEGAKDIVLTADFNSAVVEASKTAFEKTFGFEDLSSFALNQKDNFGQSARIQVKASAIGFEANPGDIVYVAIFNPETGEFVQVEGKMGESGFITFHTELSGVVVMSLSSFK